MTAEIAIPSPEEFAAAQVKRSKCTTCSHPLREQLERSYNDGQGVTIPMLARWLDVHHPTTPLKVGAMREHFRARHHVHTQS